MTKNARPLTEAELARIPIDAEAMLHFIRANGRPGSARGTLTVVKPRAVMADLLGLSVRRLSRAEQVLTTRRVVKAVALVPRNEDEAEERIFRWTLRTEERTNP